MSAKTPDRLIQREGIRGESIRPQTMSTPKWVMGLPDDVLNANLHSALTNGDTSHENVQAILALTDEFLRRLPRTQAGGAGAGPSPGQGPLTTHGRTTPQIAIAKALSGAPTAAPRTPRRVG